MAKTLEERVGTLELLAQASAEAAQHARDCLYALESRKDAEELRDEQNAALRERVAMLEKSTYLGLCPPEWPTPQPIETAPLGQLMAWDPSGDVSEGFGPAWVHEWPNPGMTVEEWRALLKTWGRTHWLPMPPPGGGK